MRILRSKSGHNTIFDVALEGGETTPVMVVDSQFDPVKETLLHVDLKRIDLTKRMRVPCRSCRSASRRASSSRAGFWSW